MPRHSHSPPQQYPDRQQQSHRQQTHPQSSSASSQKSVPHATDDRVGYIHMYACMYLHMHTHTYVPTYRYIHTCIHAFAHTYIHAYTQTYIVYMHLYQYTRNIRTSICTQLRSIIIIITGPFLQEMLVVVVDK